MDTAEVCGLGSDGIFERQTGDSDVSAIRKVRQAVLGRHLWGRGYCVSTVGIDETRIREYVQWQENKEREMEKLQGNLFGEAEN